jgi:CheY-like chemotaxis protein
MGRRGGNDVSPVGESRATAAVREALETFAVTPIRDEIVRRALEAHGSEAIPDSGKPLAEFVSGPLRDAVISLFDRETADAVMRMLAPVVGRAGKSADSGMRRRVTSGEILAKRGRMVLCMGTDTETVATLAQRLSNVADVVTVEDVLEVRDVIGDLSATSLRVVIDTRTRHVRAGRIGSIARQLPPGTRVMLWGVTDAEARLLQVTRADLDWLPVGAEAGPDDIATLCTVSGVSGARMRPVVPERPILVVDHDAGSRRALADCISALGYPVVTAATGAEALALCAQRPPRLVIADQGLPGMSGVEMAHLLRRSGGPQSPPIVVLVTDVLESGDLTDIDVALPKDLAEDRLAALIERLTPRKPST